MTQFDVFIRAPTRQLVILFISVLTGEWRVESGELKFKFDGQVVTVEVARLEDTPGELGVVDEIREVLGLQAKSAMKAVVS